MECYVYCEENLGLLKILIRETDRESACVDLIFFTGLLKSYSLTSPSLQTITTVKGFLFTFCSASSPSLCHTCMIFFLTL